MKKKKTEAECLKADEDFRSICAVYYSVLPGTEMEEEAWHEMFDLVYDASEAAVKKRLKGIYRPDIDEIILDTAMNVMKSLKKTKEKKEVFELKNKLVSFCSLHALYPLYNKQERFENSMLSLNRLYEEGGDAVLESCKKY